MSKENADVQKEIEILVKHETDLLVFRERILDYHPFDVAKVFSEINSKEREKFYNSLDPSEFARILEYLESNLAGKILLKLNSSYRSKLVECLEIDDAVDIIQEIDDEETRKKIRLLLDKDISSEIRELEKYEEDEAGSIMTTSYITVNISMTVKEAMKELVKNAPNVEYVNTLYVVDNVGCLKGLVSLKELIIARSHQLIKDIIPQHVQFVSTHDSVESALRQIQDYDLPAIPVINAAQRLAGIITVDDALDEIVDTKDSEYAKLAGLLDDDNNDVGVFRSVKLRIPWLIILLCLGAVISTVIAGFETTIAAIPILALFMPLILGLAGNGGTQSLAVTVRGLSDNTINNNKTILSHLLREVRIALINGVIIAFAAFAVVSVFRFFGEDTITSYIAFVVALSAGVSLMISTVAGALIPIVMTKIKVDPAVASGPFITTLNDLIAVSVYFGLATILLL